MKSNIHPFRTWISRFLGLLWLLVILLIPSVRTVFAQNNPAEQCEAGTTLYLEGKQDEAYPLLEAGFSGRANANFDSLDDLGYCALLFGYLRAEAGNMEGALEAYLVALDTFQQTENRLTEALAHDNIGGVYLALGRYDEALAAFGQALTIRREMNERAAEGWTLNNIGSVHRAQGRYDEALVAYEQALAIRRELDDRAGEGATLFNIGAVHRAQGQHEEALVAYKQALAIRRDLRDRADEGETLNELGSVYLDLGRYEEALAAYEQALAIMRQERMRTWEGTALSNIGTVYEAQGRYEEALTAYERALVIRREVDDRAGEGVTLNNMGGVYLDQGRYEEALAAYEQALSIRREVDDRAGEGVTLSNIGTIYEAQGRYEEALAVHEQALAIMREVDDRAGEGKSLNNIGAAYKGLSAYKDALRAYEQALGIMREVANPVGEGVTLNNIGTVYGAQGRFDEALVAYEQALDIARDVGNPIGEGATLSNIGNVFLDLGRYDEALATYEQALDVAREVGNRAGEAATLNNIGSVYHNLGRYEEALAAYEQALAITREVDDRAGEGTTISNIGAVYESQGRYEEALAMYEEALAITREVRNRAGEAITLNNIGAVYQAQGRYDEALTNIEQSLAIMRELDNGIGEGTALNNAATLYLDLGRYEEALAAYEQALTIRRDLGDRAGEAVTLNNIGNVKHKQGRYEEALAAYEQALEIMREVGDRAAEGTTLGNLGFVYHRQGDAAGDALSYYREGMRVLESLRTAAGSDIGRSAFIARFSGLYQLALSLQLEEGERTEAFFTSERGRGRSFLDSLTTGDVQLADNAAVALIDAEQQAHTERQALQDAIARARAQTSPDETLIADLEAQLAEAEATHEDAVNAIMAHGERLASLIPGRGLDYVLTVEEVQEHLDEDTTLVSYFLYVDIDEEERAVAFILTPNAFDVVTLPTTASDLTRQITFFRAFGSLDDLHPASLQRLNDALINPLASYLETPHLIIVPHGVLHYLPFAALSDGERYLGDQFVISTLPSASILPLLPEGQLDTGLLVLGNPDTRTEGLADLPHAQQEALEIAKIFGTQALVQEAATESVVHEKGKEAGILHIAAHGAFDPFAPLQSALYLASDAQHDGRLHVDEMYGLDLSRTDLVVLSACQTQLGTINPGDDTVAMNRALIFAGAPTIVASLWNVADEATSILMTRFYGYLNDGWGKAEALRQAQIDLRTESPEYAHPFYWAGFVLTGEADSVTQTTALLQLASDKSNSSEAVEQSTDAGRGGGLCLAVLLLALVWWSFRRLSISRRRKV